MNKATNSFGGNGSIIVQEQNVLKRVFVLGVGDRAFRRKSQARLEQMMHESKLIIIVSHSSSFILQTCTHCLWLQRGEKKMFGPAKDVVDAYHDVTGGPDEPGGDS